MDSSTFRVGSGEFNRDAHPLNLPSKLKTYGFAIAIIVAIGGLAVGGAGLAGYFHVGALSNLSQVHAIIMMAAGGGGGTALLIIGIVGLVKNYKTGNGSEEEVLDTLTKFAKKEGDAFLIDFSKIKPSNIFKIFKNGGTSGSSADGNVEISDTIRFDESDKFTQNFPFKYSISFVLPGKNRHGYKSSAGYMLTMNDEGKVESYGKVFDNFDVYLEHFMKDRIYHASNYLTFKHWDFHSIWTNDGYKKLRKKSSATDT